MCKISVIIPTYNRANELKRAVISVLDQTFRVDEILIINDGALEDDICLSIKSLDKRVQIYHNSKSMGGNYSRNKGASISTGEILMFLDDDDTWNKDKVLKQIEIFERNSLIGLVYSNRNVVDHEGMILRKITSKSIGNLYPKIFFDNIIGGTSSVAVKREVFFNAGKFDEQLPALQDYDLWIRICKITSVGLDPSYSVNYKMDSNFSGQVTGSIEKKSKAVSLILNKYGSEISDLGTLATRKIKSKLYLSMCRSLRGRNKKMCFQYSLKSFIYYPSFRSLYFMFLS